jgi:signal transduction histidine kinase/ActR/RegA family two-component response regulator
VVEDVTSDPVFASQRDVALLAGFRAVHCTPLMTRSGRVIGTLCTHFTEPHRPSEWEMHLLDLCARQAVDAIENARLYAELQQSHQRKDEFLATLAHELRNPLAPIRNAVEIMRAQRAVDPAQSWSTEVIDRQVGQLKRLVDDLLDLSRITTGKLELRVERVELGQVVASALETSRPLIEAGGQELAVSLPAQPVFLDADPMRLAQVIANLLNNAAKYTERGGKIWLSARREGSEAVISVRDTGTGIDAATMPRIFEMFGQLDRSPERSHGGLGIGLTLVSRLVRLHGGAISAHSEGRGQGSEFVVRLRAVQQQPQEALPAESETVVAGRPLRILVVDDNQDAAASLRMLLQIKGHEVRMAHDGAEAVAVAGDYRPDVVLLDIGLPKLNGFDAARSMRRMLAGKRVLIVAMTGWGQKTDRERSKQAGFDHHLVKPADPAQVLALLDSFAQGRGLAASGVERPAPSADAPSR